MYVKSFLVNAKKKKKKNPCFIKSQVSFLSIY